MDKSRRKELVNESARKLSAQMGVYQIKNNANGKIYLGSSSNPDTKLLVRKGELQGGNFFIRELQEDWKKFGEENFSFEVLERLEPKDGQSMADNTEDLQALLELLLEKLQPYGERGYHKKKN
jgi:hypothetical protein